MKKQGGGYQWRRIVAPVASGEGRTPYSEAGRGGISSAVNRLNLLKGHEIDYNDGFMPVRSRTLGLQQASDFNF